MGLLNPDRAFSLDFKNGSFPSPTLGKVATVVWSREGADGYGRQET